MVTLQFLVSFLIMFSGVTVRAATEPTSHDIFGRFAITSIEKLRTICDHEVLQIKETGELGGNVCVVRLKSYWTPSKGDNLDPKQEYVAFGYGDICKWRIGRVIRAKLQSTRCDNQITITCSQSETIDLSKLPLATKNCLEKSKSSWSVVAFSNAPGGPNYK